MYGDPHNAYDNATRASASSRELEAAALNKAARLLETSIREWETPGAEARLGEALRHNQRLWTFFQAELSDPASPLPNDLRSNLLGLSVFVDRRTFEIMTNAEPSKVRALIDINRNIAAGLATAVPEDATARS